MNKYLDRLIKNFFCYNNVSDVDMAKELKILLLYEVSSEEIKDVKLGQETLLCSICRNGYIETLNFLLVLGIDVNQKGWSGWTPLMNAAFKDHTCVIDLLIKSGALIDEKSYLNRTALIIAAFWGKEASVEALLKYNPLINIQDNYGKTAYDYATLKGYTKISEMIGLESEKRGTIQK